MALRESFRPLRPDLDKFLFAEMGAEKNGVPLSMVSALARLGLDPWEEAGRLSSLGKREAIEQLARQIAELPDGGRPLAEAREIAGGLIELLPKHDSNPTSQPIPGRRQYRWPTVFPQSKFVVFCVAAAVAALVSVVLHGGFSFGFGFP